MVSISGTDYKGMSASAGLKLMIDLLNKGDREDLAGGKRFVGRRSVKEEVVGLIGYERQRVNGREELVEIFEDEDGNEINSFDKGKPKVEEIESFKQRHVYNIESDLESFYGSSFLTRDDSDLYYTPNVFKMTSGKSTDNVTYLTCLWVDIDNVTVEQAEDRLTDSGLPTPTVAISTGRGVHYYWIFDFKVSPRQSVSKKARQYGYNYLTTWSNLINYYVYKLDGDRKAVDAGRYLRIPGSINTKTGDKAEVLYINEDKYYNILELNKMYLRDRDERVKAVNSGYATRDSLYKEWLYLVKDDKRKVEVEQPTTVVKKGKKRYEKSKEVQLVDTVRYGMNNYEYLIKQDLITLGSLRGGIDEGHRFYYLTTLRQFGAQEDELARLNRTHIKKPYTRKQLDYILTKEMNYKVEGLKPKRDTIVGWLDITPDEEYELRVLMRAPIATVKKQIREVKQESYSLIYQYNQLLKRLVIHSFSGKKWTVERKAELLSLSESEVYRVLREDERELSFAEIMNREGRFSMSRENKLRAEIVEKSFSVIHKILGMLEVIYTHELPEKALVDYLEDLTEVEERIVKVSEIITGGEVIKNGKTRVREVENQVRAMRDHLTGLEAVLESSADEVESEDVEGIIETGQGMVVDLATGEILESSEVEREDEVVKEVVILEEELESGRVEEVKEEVEVIVPRKFGYRSDLASLDKLYKKEEVKRSNNLAAHLNYTSRI